MIIIQCPKFVSGLLISYFLLNSEAVGCQQVQVTKVVLIPHMILIL